MSKEERKRELPSLRTEIEFLSKVTSKRIMNMEYMLNVHFGHGVSKRIREEVRLDIDILMGNVKDATKILKGIQEKSTSEYIPHDIDELIMALALLGRVELTTIQHIAEIYKNLDTEDYKEEI